MAVRLHGGMESWGRREGECLMGALLDEGLENSWARREMKWLVDGCTVG